MKKNVKECDDDKKFKPGLWYRFQFVADEHSMKLAENCPSIVTNQTYLTNRIFCGAQYRGWIQGSHPTIEEGSLFN